MHVGAPRSAPGTVFTRHYTTVSIDDDVLSCRGRCGCGSAKACWTWRSTEFLSSPSSTLWQCACAFTSKTHFSHLYDEG